MLKTSHKITRQQIISMKKLLVIAIAFLACAGCKKETGPEALQQHDSVMHAKQHETTVGKRFEPEQKSAETLGEVTLNKTLYTVAAEFTDTIVFKQEAVNTNGQPDVLNYREKLVHLINSSKDTITVKKSLFKGHLPDYDKMILQGALLNHKFKSGAFPLLVYFCMPDSDYCYYFDVTISPSGTIVLKKVEEDEY
jgi:hypothetical protein